MFARGTRLLLWSLALALVACAESRPRLEESPPPTVHLDPEMADDPARVGPLILAHGGQGSPASRSAGVEIAVDEGFSHLDQGALAAAIATIEVLEDDPQFNAGTGANLRLDGRSIEADAAIMDDRGSFGAVAGLADLRHPVRVAEAVAASPHLLIVGDGAQRFAETLGLERRDLSTARARAKLGRGYARLLSEVESERVWVDYDWRARWNFATPAPEDLAAARALLEAGAEAEAGSSADGQAANDDDEVEIDETKDTVGVVVRSADGRYAAALSTGGTTLAMHGRVGDVPLLGAGLYAGPRGAVAATGKGEAIIRELVAYEVYRRLARGELPRDAIRLAIRGISEAEGVGVIAVSDRGWGAVATSQMAWAARDRSAGHRADRWIQRHYR